MQIPQIEPFQFTRSTAFSERVQLANKINEIIAGINQIGDIPELQEEIETLKGQVETINSTIETIQSDVSGNTANIQTLTEQLTTLSGTVQTAVQNIAALQTLTGTHSTQIRALQDSVNALTPRVSALESRATAIESDIQNIDNEITGLQAEVIDNVSMMSDAHGTVQVTIAHEDGSTDTSAPIDLGLVRQGGITLQTGATDRSFNLTINLTDGTSWQTNDFIIPPGGGTEVVVTSIQIADGTSEGTMKVRIGLSDSTFLDSNDWPYVTPTELNAVATRVTALEGTTAQHTTQIGDLTSRVEELEDNPFSLPIATASVLGGIKVGANLKVTGDGTLSADPVPDVSELAVASSLVVSRNASGMNVVISDEGGTQHTEAVPLATAALPGLMSPADKQAVDGIPGQISDLEGQITALDISKPSDNQLEMNGSTVNLIEDVSMEIIDESTLKIGVNGVNSQVVIPTPIPTFSFSISKILAGSAANMQALMRDINNNIGHFIYFTALYDQESPINVTGLITATNLIEGSGTMIQVNGPNYGLKGISFHDTSGNKFNLQTIPFDAEDVLTNLTLNSPRLSSFQYYII